MKKWLALTGLILFLLPLSIHAQKRHICGVTAEEDDLIFHEMTTLRARYPNAVMPRNTVWIPVWFHLSANNDGTGRVLESRALDMLCEWNRIYQVNNTLMQFYLKGFNYINSSIVHNSPRTFDASQVMDLNKKGDGMNVFLCATADDGGQTGAVTLAYYSPFNDWIVCASDQVATSTATTIAHEAGHFFSLPHTFRGFDADPFCPTVAASCAPVRVSLNGVFITVEKVPRTGAVANCTSAGDGFCDTEADYNMNLADSRTCNFTETNCQYIGIAKDPDCVPVNPDETLIMGYYLGCMTKFSTQQKTAMMNNYTNAANRAYLRSQNVQPPQADLTPPNLISPANGATTPFSNNVTLDWSDVPNARGYIVEIANLSSFLGSTTVHTTTSALQISPRTVSQNVFGAGRNLFWRVRPYGNYKTCSTQNNVSVVSARGQFIWGTTNSTKEIEGASNLTVSPNPLPKMVSLNVSLQSEKAFEAQIKIYNTVGQLVQTEKRNFGVGFSNHTLTVNNLNSGVYILSVESATGILTQRFVVQD
jgi:hypothetical protein